MKVRQLCTKAHCGLPSLPGLIKGCGKCPYHWAEGVWGTAHAARVHPEHPEAKKYQRSLPPQGDQV